MPRHPSTPDCAVRGCSRAAYRLGICRGHAHLIPITTGVACAVECMEAQKRVKRRHHAAVAALVNAAVDAGRRSAAAA